MDYLLPKEKTEEQAKQDAEHSKEVSLSRTKQNLIGLLRANKWDYFITLTFDRKLVDSSSYEEICKKACKYMNNLKERKCPDLKYVLVPELHKDGEHYHIHGVLGNTDGLQTRFSGKTDKKRKIIYNLPTWKYGFSTATEIEDNEAVSNYIAKYITKDTENLLKGKQRYWSSRNCTKIDDITETMMIDDTMDFIATLLAQEKVKSIKSQDIPVTDNIIHYIET